MNLTPLIRKLQAKLRRSEAQALKHQDEARAIRARLAEITKLLGGLGVRLRRTAAARPARKRRKAKISAKGRAAIARAQKRRWAAWKARRPAAKAAKAAPRKAKRKMSAAGRARIIEAQKRRWAAWKAKQAPKA
jgi:virulence-associated protein VagC